MSTTTSTNKKTAQKTTAIDAAPKVLRPESLRKRVEGKATIVLKSSAILELADYIERLQRRLDHAAGA